MSIKNFIQHHKTLSESAIMEATVSELRMMGEDQDEILDALAFINKGIGKGNQKVKLPFGTDTLDALEKDSHRDGATYILAVKANRPGAGYVDTVNDFLDDHGFECRLMDGRNYTLAAQEIVELAKTLIKKSEEQLSMRKETNRATKVASEVDLSNLYYSLIEILGEFYNEGMAPFKKQAKDIMLKKYKLYMTDEYGFKINENTTDMKYFKLFESFVNEARLTDMESDLLKEIEKLGFTADGAASPVGRSIHGAKDYANGRVSIYINTTSANHYDDSVIEVEVYFIPLYFVKRFFGLKKDKGLDMTKMKSLLPGKQQSQIIDLGTGLFDRSPEDNIKDIVKLIKDADKEYNKEYQNYQPEVNEAELNEAKADLKLSTHDALEGTVGRYRLGSEVINLARVADLNNHMSVRDARVFSDSEIGFESAADRKAAMRFIESSFKQGALDVGEYSLEESLTESQKDMMGKKCKVCHKGTYRETSLMDDMHGILHCNKCDAVTDRWVN